MTMENVSGVLLDGKDITLVGTAHVSKESKDEVSKLISLIKPDVIGVELCSKRLEGLKNPDLNLQGINYSLNKGDYKQLIFQTILYWYESRIAKKLNANLGAEMIEAVNLAEKNDIKLALLDRDISTTLSRLLFSLSIKDKLELLYGLFNSLSAKITVKDIESLKEHSTIDALIDELGKSAPVLKRVLVDERDEYIANEILKIKEKKVLVFLGAGHIKGVRKNLLEKKEKVQFFIARKNSFNFLILFYSVLALTLAFGYLRSVSVLFEMLKYWLIASSAGAFLGCVLSLSNLLTILAGTLLAPVLFFKTAGLVAHLSSKQLSMKDVSNISTINSLRDVYKNKLTKTLLLYSLVTIFNILSSVLVLPFMWSLFF